MLPSSRSTGKHLELRDSYREAVSFNNGISLAPLWDQNVDPPELCGLIAVVAGMEFSLVMRPQAHRVGYYRPSVFRMTSSQTGAQGMVILGWDYPHEVQTVDMTV